MDSGAQHQCMLASLDRWYQTPLGRCIVADERQLLEAHLPALFGYTLLQIGGATLFDGYQYSPINQKIIIGAEGGIEALPEALPIQSDSIDLAILPHTIELSSNPHQLLREVERVLIPEGHLLLFGFNPWSFWGLRRLLSSKAGELPWSLRYHSPGKVGDWLSLLGFESLDSRCHLFMLPFHHISLPEGGEAIFNRYFPRLGGGYCLLVRKRISTLTPIKPAWGKRNRMTGLGLNGSAMRRVP